MIVKLVYKFYEYLLLIFTICCVVIIGLIHLVFNILYGISMLLTASVSKLLELILVFLDN